VEALFYGHAMPHIKQGHLCRSEPVPNPRHFIAAMFSINAILHPTDFSPGARQALACAIAMARHRARSLFLSQQVTRHLSAHPSTGTSIHG
jgi:hypothetical protein